MSNFIKEIVSMFLVWYVSTCCLFLPIHAFTDIGFDKSLLLSVVLGCLIDILLTVFFYIYDKRKVGNSTP